MPKQRMPYGTARWQKRRAQQLTDEPLCWMHLERGEVVPATIADHDPPRLRSLCKPCHDSDKQRMEKGGTPKSRYGDDGWPI